MTKRCGRWALAVAACVACVIPNYAEETHPQKEMSPSDISENVGGATVVIRTKTSSGSLISGSGFVVESNGTIITNFHVVQDAERIDVQFPGGDTYTVSKVHGIDREKDIAILGVPGFDLPTAPMGNSNTVGAGDRIVVIGTALGVLDNSVTSGVISGIRELDGYRLFQMDAAISKGNSGGPVVNEQGEVVGISVAKLNDGESLNFAIPINYARGLLSMEHRLSLSELSSRSEESLFASDSSTFPKRWKSLASGTTKIIRRDGIHLYIETLISDQFTQAGGMVIAELTQDGDKWVGKTRNKIPCQTRDGGWTRIKRKRCTFEWNMELYEFTPTRISGKGTFPPEGSELKCRQCRYSDAPVLQEFVWIPE